MYVLLGCSAIALNLCAARLPAVAPGAATLLHAAHVPGRCHTSPRCSDRPLEAAPAASLYGAWPVWERPPVEYDTIVSTFVEVTTSVPLRASSEKGDGWREWADGGFAAHLLISRKLSRKTYISALQGLLELVVRIQQKYPDLYSVLKFVPKKNGLNPELAKLANGEEIQSLEDARPREVKRAVSDVQRAIEQSWLLLCCYLTLPSRQMREDMLWSARTVVEKIKTDQRSHALEMLCLAFFWRGSDEYRLLDHALWPPLKQSFESNFGANWHPKPTNARMVWQRCRMVYPFLEVAHRAWLSASSEDGVPEEWKRGSEDIAYMLDRIARAGPEEKVINSLLYWLLDAWFDVMLTGEKIPAWAPEPFILRREGVATRLSVEVANMGHLLDLVALCGETDEEGHCVITEKDVGDQMLLQVKQVETTATLLASIRNSCAEACPLVLQEYDALLRSSSLSLSQLQRVEFDALGALFELDGDTVANRSEEVLNTLFEWRNPELLFRYYEDNRGDDRLGPLIARWLRAIFKLSDETLDEIRRDSPASMKQMSHFPPEVLERWYAADCQGTSECKTLFMVGEDAGSCLRVISNEGNRYNRALMGYVLQPNCRVLVVTDSVGRVMARSLVRLLVRSDTREPIIFADPMFFTLGFSYELQAELLFQARLLQEHMQVPVVHSCSVLPSPQDPDHLPEGCYVREVRQLDYDVRWVDLLEMDGIAPYTYSEELPYDELLQQHHAGVLERTDEDRALAIAVLPRSDSPSAERYKKERQGLTGWTMVPKKLIDAVAAKNARARSAMPYGDGGLSWRGMVASHARTLPMAMGYTVCSSMLLVTNKLAIQAWPYPSLLMAVQFLVSAGVVRGLSFIGWLDVEPLVLHKVKAFWMVPFFFELAIFASIKLLAASSVETAIVFRTTVPLITSWADWAFMGREAPSTKSAMSLIVIVLGALIYARSSSGGLVLHVWMWALLYLSVLSFEMVYVKHVLNRLPMTTWTRVYYNNALALLFWPPFLLLGNEHRHLQEAFAALSESRAAATVSISCVLGVGISFTGFGLRNLVTATTFTVLGVMNKVLTVLMSYLLISGAATFMGVVGLFACIGAGTMYEQAPPRASDSKTTGRRWGHSDIGVGAEEQEEMEAMLGGGK